MSLKIHFLYSHLSFFSEKLGEQCAQFHQDIAKMEHCSKEDRSHLCWGIAAGFSAGKVKLPKKEGSNLNNLTIIKQFLFIWYLNNAKYEQKLIKIL
jgi:hypothetical protein